MAVSVLYSPTDWIYIICKKSCYISALRISGPIVAPRRVRMATAYCIVCSGIELYQYEPSLQEYAKMTIKNAFRKDKFKSYNANAAVARSTSTMSLRSAASDEETTTNPAQEVVEKVLETTEKIVEEIKEKVEDAIEEATAKAEEVTEATEEEVTEEAPVEEATAKAEEVTEATEEEVTEEAPVEEATAKAEEVKADSKPSNSNKKKNKK